MRQLLYFSCLVLAKCIPDICLNRQFPGSDDSCEDVDSARKDWGHFSRPRNLTCGFALVNAGSPRSGSTLLDELTKDAVARVQKYLVPGLTVLDHGYWRFDRHLASNILYKIPNGWQRGKNWTLPANTGADIYLTKIHEFDSDLLRFCGPGKTIVLLTRRDPAAMAVSFVKAGFVQENDCTGLIKYLHNFERAQQCWQRFAMTSLKFRYEELASQPALVASSIISLLGSILADSPPNHDDLFKAVRFADSYGRDEANKMFPGSSRAADASRARWRKRRHMENESKSFDFLLRKNLPANCGPQVLRECFPYLHSGSDSFIY